MQIAGLPSWYIYSAAFILGALWGSFANVCIARIPVGGSVLWPPSRCPFCRTPIRAFDNIPVFSWLLLGERCRDCRVRIPARYPMVELLVATLSLALAIRSATPGTFVVFFCFTLALVVLSFIDLDHWLLPNVITYPGIVAGLAVSFAGLENPAGLVVAPVQSLIGALLGGGILYAVAIIFKAATGKVGMGMGDVKLLAMVGAFLGWQAILPVVMLSSLQGSIAGLILLFVRKDDVGGKERSGHRPDEFVPGRHHIPYGPFIALGAIEYMFYGPALFDVATGLIRLGLAR